MTVTLTPAGPEQEPVFANLLQLYYYDFSELLRFEIGGDGRYPFERHRDYWSDPRYRPFLIHAEGHLAGLAIVDARSRLTDEPLSDVSQFFVLRKHRGAGVGARAAAVLFDAFRGPWEVRVEARNAPGQVFWRKSVERYARGQFTETKWDDERFHGIVLRFDNAE